MPEKEGKGAPRNKGLRSPVTLHSGLGIDMEHGFFSVGICGAVGRSQRYVYIYIYISFERS